MFKATVNQRSISIEHRDGKYFVNDAEFPLDLSKIDSGTFHVLAGPRSMTAEIVKMEEATKTCRVKVNGKIFDVELKDRFDMLLEQMGMQAVGAGKVNNIKAPIPGLIIDLRVKEGDEVQAGDPILILEAMKMENIIKSPGAGKIKTVRIKKGESVEKNQVLVEF